MRPASSGLAWRISRAASPTRPGPRCPPTPASGSSTRTTDCRTASIPQSCVRLLAAGCIHNDLCDIHLFSVLTNAKLAVLRGHSRLVYALEFAQDDRLLMTVAADANCRIWSTATYKCVHLVPHPVPVYAGKFVSNSLVTNGELDKMKYTTLITGARDGCLRLFKLFDGVEEAEVIGDWWAPTCSCSPKSRRTSTASTRFNSRRTRCEW